MRWNYIYGKNLISALTRPVFAKVTVMVTAAMPNKEVICFVREDFSVHPYSTDSQLKWILLYSLDDNIWSPRGLKI